MKSGKRPALLSPGAKRKWRLRGIPPMSSRGFCERKPRGRFHHSYFLPHARGISQFLLFIRQLPKFESMRHENISIYTFRSISDTRGRENVHIINKLNEANVGCQESELGIFTLYNMYSQLLNIFYFKKNLKFIYTITTLTNSFFKSNYFYFQTRFFSFASSSFNRKIISRFITLQIRNRILMQETASRLIRSHHRQTERREMIDA